MRAEYALCAARGPDREYGLYVSVCDYREYQEDYEDQDGNDRVRPAIEFETHLVRPDDLPLPLRVRILDVLDRFVKVYESHVQKDRKSLLNGSEDSGQPG